jgi:hypothetical protein
VLFVISDICSLPKSLPLSCLACEVERAVNRQAGSLALGRACQPAREKVGPKGPPRPLAPCSPAEELVKTGFVCFFGSGSGSG